MGRPFRLHPDVGTRSRPRPWLALALPGRCLARSAPIASRGLPSRFGVLGRLHHSALCRARWRPPPPQRAEGQGMVNSPIRFMALSSSACTGSPLRCLNGAFSRHWSRKISTPNWRDLHRLVTQRAARPHAWATVHRWPSPSGPAGKAWPGENVDEPSSPAFTQAHQQQLSSQNYRSCSGPRTLRLSQFCVQGNRVRLMNLLSPPGTRLSNSGSSVKPSRTFCLHREHGCLRSLSQPVCWVASS